MDFAHVFYATQTLSFFYEKISMHSCVSFQWWLLMFESSARKYFEHCWTLLSLYTSTYFYIWSCINLSYNHFYLADLINLLQVLKAFLAHRPWKANESIMNYESDLMRFLSIFPTRSSNKQKEPKDSSSLIEPLLNQSQDLWEFWVQHSLLWASSSDHVTGPWSSPNVDVCWHISTFRKASNIFMGPFWTPVPISLL